VLTDVLESEIPNSVFDPVQHVRLGSSPKN